MKNIPIKVSPHGFTVSWFLIQCSLIVAFAILFTSLQKVYAQETEQFAIGDLVAVPGQKVTGKLIIEKGSDAGSFIPVSIVCGEKPGPVLTMTAGVHGTEYVPVIALQKILREIDPAELSGVLVLVHVTNVPSFLGRGVYSNPIDSLNLNRVFPGKMDGTFSERLAYTLTNEIIGKSDYYIDLHGGEFNERVLNYLYFYYGCPDKELCRQSRLMAHAMGNTHLIPFDYSSVPDSMPSEYTDFEAMRRGIPSIAVEYGDMGKVDPEILEFAIKGIMNVMRTIGMLKGEPFVVKQPFYLLDEYSMESESDGIFYSLVDKGDLVEEAALLGYVTDFWGNKLEEFRAPFSGIVYKTNSSPAINKGEHVIKMARVADNFNLE
ncbi:MAG: succinylglutamate desuccinylase/aspartoacylase family protein [Bacteroidota bacterium]|nr:succinylglutamate desuccinylase/aspartoacylase family protein [Bacteroidota bacterium]